MGEEAGRQPRTEWAGMTDWVEAMKRGKTLVDKKWRANKKEPRTEWMRKWKWSGGQAIKWPVDGWANGDKEDEKCTGKTVISSPLWRDLYHLPEWAQRGLLSAPCGLCCPWGFCLFDPSGLFDLFGLFCLRQPHQRRRGRGPCPSLCQGLCLYRLEREVFDIPHRRRGGPAKGRKRAAGIPGGGSARVGRRNRP